MEALLLGARAWEPGEEEQEAGSLRRWGRPPGWGGYQQGRREDGASAEATGPATHAATGPATHARTQARTPTQGVLTVTTGGLRSLTCSAHVALGGGTQPRARYGPRRLGSASGFQPALCAPTL